ncbi:MAG: hypothetical protein LBL04_02395 [Bacteroidales bacterium]|jgi:DNA-binding IscR family transcriptional regulator|nr:hypothetical protein [Bacteroidales bacterium]
MDENQENKEKEALKGRARMRQLLSEVHPEKQYADDSEEDMDDFLAQYDELSGKHGKLKESSERIAEAIRSNPKVAMMFQDIIEKRNPLKSIVGTYGKSVLEMDPESEEFGEIVAAEDEHARMQAEEAERSAQKDAEFQQNLADSEAAFQAFAQEKGMDEKGFGDFFNAFYGMFAAPVFEGVYTKDLLDAAYRALNYDQDVQDAEKAGEVKAKNAKIVAMKKEQVGDGLPGLQGSSDLKEKKTAASIFPKMRSGWDAG